MAPTRCDLRASTHLAFDPAALTVNDFELTLDGAGPTATLHALLKAPLTVRLDDPLSVLKEPRELADITLGPVPLDWFNGVAAGHSLAGELEGHFGLAIDTQQRVELAPVTPTTVRGVSVVVTAKGSDLDLTASVAQPMVEALDLTLHPSASWSPRFLRYALRDLTIAIHDQALLHADLKAASKSAAADTRGWRYRVHGDLDYDTLSAMPLAAAYLHDYPLPAGLKLNFKTRVAQHDQAVSIETTELAVHEAKHPDVLHVGTLRPFNFTLSEGKPQFTNPTGQLATSSTPRPVATPLPPRNFSQTG